MMVYRKVAGPVRLDTTPAGGKIAYAFEGAPGGRMVKTLKYMIKILQQSSTNAITDVDVQEGPDDEIYRFFKTALCATVAPTPTAPYVLAGAVGDADSNAEVVGE